MVDTFEYSFPGVWRVVDANGSSYGEYYWWKVDCRKSLGRYGAWAVGGGVNGRYKSCHSNYPNRADSWMIYGPFSLADAHAAYVYFELWLNTELNHDGFLWLASTNGTDFYGPTGLSGYSNGWLPIMFDLTHLAGRTNVWIGFRFASDNAFNLPEGAYVDNIVLRKCVSQGCIVSDDGTREADNGQMAPFSVKMPIVRPSSVTRGSTPELGGRLGSRPPE